MSDAILRQLTLLRHLPRAGKGKMTSGGLMRYLNDHGFKISKRSVERNLEMLSGPPFYIQRDNAKTEGWCWARDAKPIEIPGDGACGRADFQACGNLSVAAAAAIGAQTSKLFR